MYWLVWSCLAFNSRSAIKEESSISIIKGNFKVPVDGVVFVSSFPVAVLNAVSVVFRLNGVEKSPFIKRVNLLFDSLKRYELYFRPSGDFLFNTCFKNSVAIAAFGFP